MKNNNSFKYKIGMLFIIFGIISPLFGLVVPLLGLSPETTTMVVTFFMVGAPEIFLIAGGALAGKEAMETIKSRLFQSAVFQPAGKTRYQIGLFLLISGVIGNWVFAYIEMLSAYTLEVNTQLFITIIFDVLAVAGILMMGVEFFAKLKKLFVWQGAV